MMEAMVPPTSAGDPSGPGDVAMSAASPTQSSTLSIVFSAPAPPAELPPTVRAQPPLEVEPTESSDTSPPIVGAEKSVHVTSSLDTTKPPKLDQPEELPLPVSVEPTQSSDTSPPIVGAEESVHVTSSLGTTNPPKLDQPDELPLPVSVDVCSTPEIADLLSLDNAAFTLPPAAPVVMFQPRTVTTTLPPPEESDAGPAPSPFQLQLQDIAMSPREQSVPSSSSFASSGRKSARAAQLTLDTSAPASPRQKLSPLHVEVPTSPRRSSKTSQGMPSPQHPPASPTPQEDVVSDWMVCRTDAGDTYYYNIKRQESQWATPPSLQLPDRPFSPPAQAPIETEPDCLHVAVSNGDLPRVQELLAAGVAIDGLDDDGRSPLWYALEHLEIAVLLLKQSPSKHHIVAQDLYGTTLLHVVTRQRNIEMLTLLLLQAETSEDSPDRPVDPSDRLDVDARDSHQQTALHVAATFGFRKCVEMLLAQGASPAVLDENSQTPIMLATLGGHVGCVQLLQVALSALLKQTEVAVQAAPIQETTRVHQLQEQVAATARALEETQRANELLLEEVERYRLNMSLQLREKDALETAYRIANSRLAMLEALAKRTADDHDHEKRMWQQREAGYIEAHESSMVVIKNLQLDVDALVANHVPLESTHGKGRRSSSPVPTRSKDSFDVSASSPGKRSRLPSSNAVTEDTSYEHDWALDPSSPDNDQTDGAAYAPGQQPFYPVDPSDDFEPNQHASPARPSADRVDAVWAQFFMNAAAAASARTDGPQEPVDRGLMQAVLDADIDDVQARLSNGQSPNQRDNLRRTSLHLATDRGDTVMLALLCDFLGDIEARDAKGNTPLHIACFRGHVGCVRFLVESAADVNVVNADGESVVHAAASGGSLPCLRLALEYGASPFHRNEDGETAYDMLLERDGPVAHLLDCLQEAMAPKQTKTFRGTPVPPTLFTTVDDDADEFVSPPSSPMAQSPPHEVHIYGNESEADDEEDGDQAVDQQHRGMTPDGWGGWIRGTASSMFGLTRVKPDRIAGAVDDSDAGLSSPLKPPTDAEVLTTTKYHELVPPAHVSEAMQYVQSSKYATSGASMLELPQDVAQAMREAKAAPNRYAMAASHPKAMHRSASRYVDTFNPQPHAD